MIKLTQIITFKVNSRLYALLKAAAKAENRTISNYIRHKLEALVTKN